MDLNELMPFAVMTIPWLMAVFELRRGLRTGRMREYLRSEATELPNERAPKYCDRDTEPRTFKWLFAFYAAVAVLVPTGIAVVVVRRLWSNAA